MKRVGAIPRPRAKNMKGYEIKMEVKRRLQFIVPTHGRPWLTTYEIAKLIGRARSSKLQRLLDEMVVMGVLNVRDAARNNRKPGREYRLREHEARPKLELSRTIRVNGMDMFWKENMPS